MVTAACPRCASSVALHEGRPWVTATGDVELWHASCFAVRHARPVEEVTVIAPSPPSRRPVAFAAGAIASSLIAIALAHWAFDAAPPPAASVANFSVEIQAPIIQPRHVTVHEQAPPVDFHVTTALELAYPVPVQRGSALDEQFVSLRDWVHPVTNSPELMPDQASRHFGAERAGIERAECGAGHCGVDLDGPRGRPVVSVADGVVVRIERSELGLDGRSGRYVRIEHDDGTLTAYMHLDDIADGLEVGDRVAGGQFVGTLGATAVFESVPHLHFSLEVPNHPGLHGDNTDTHYVDPAPYLVRARIAPVPDRRHAAKPAM